MIPYIIIYLFATFLFFKEKVSVEFYFFLGLLILFSGFRDMIGGFDVYIYGEVFEGTKEFLMGYIPFEIGFRFYFLFLTIFSTDRHFMFFVTAAIIMSLHFFAVKKSSPIVYFSIFILFCKFFLMSFVYLRQGIAMGIFWLSIPYILNRKFLKFTAFAALAFLFHKSSIIFFPIYFISTIKFKNVNMVLIALGAVIISLSPLSTLFLGMIAENSGDEKLMVYADKSSAINIFYLIEAALLIYLMVKFRSGFYKTKFGILMLNGLFGYIVINIMALTNASFIRFGWYYIIFLAIALPYMYTLIDDKELKSKFKTLVFVYYSLLFFRLLISYDEGDLMPYKSIFQDFRRNGMWEHYEYR